MFCLRFTKKTRVQKFEADEKLSSSQSSIPATLAASPAPAPAQPAETGGTQKTKRNWRNRLFSIFQRKKKPKETPPASVESNISSHRKTPTGRVKKTSCWPFRCCWRSNRVAPSPEPKPQLERKPGPKPEPQRCDAVKDDKKVEFIPLNAPDYETFWISEESLPSDFSDYAAIMEQFFLEEMLSDYFRTKKTNISDVQMSTKGTVANFGFPNMGQTCYLNSSLQSLLTLKDLFASIQSTEPVWSSVPGAQLLRHLSEIKDKHASPDLTEKSSLLLKFKEAMSLQAPEFRDNRQKDAHEFLISVLNQIQSLSPALKEAAARFGTSYTCPVEDNLVFWMENSRTCKTCGAQTTKREKFTNISLDVVLGASIEEMLQAYQNEELLEYSCQCGGKISSRKSSLDTLPGVFIMHLKRFRVTPCYTLEKVTDPVQIQRDVVVSSNQVRK
ncbi:ubiquitin carboxyl-terminal hydrolase 37-like isoform X2 [Mugil cephalus]|uniref:ubiquitin carboxyl-terminal hydrolase 37-like isoform X2 n=1 Tax=Mugil cephalus TaxID=48193 RepID=UPI001FB5BF5A|nr:ubiquitin carboxyl-terminal hydrolase 37-like isoform X2 [Mugil cephalus]